MNNSKKNKRVKREKTLEGKENLSKEGLGKKKNEGKDQRREKGTLTRRVDYSDSEGREETEE